MTPSRRSAAWAPTADPESGPGSDPEPESRRERALAACASVGHALTRSLRGVADLAAPVRCAACRAPSPELLCALCLSGCSRPAGPCCLHCGEPWRASDADGCGRCRRFGRRFAFDRAAAVWSYDGPVRRVVHAFKFEGRADVLLPLGRLMADHPVVGAWARAARRARLVPVPAGAASRRRRGYDQAVLLARGVAQALGRRLETGALRRRRQPALSQARTAAADRLRRMGASFAARPHRVWGRHVLLVDDVLSTGATADAASRALRCAGARSVQVLTLAT
jgi:ComF family protein